MTSTPLHLPFISPLQLPFTCASSPAQLPTVTHPHTPMELRAPSGGHALHKKGPKT